MINGNFLGATQAAEYLHITKAHLYKMMRNRAITYYKPANKIAYFALADLDAYITGGLVCADNAQLDARAKAICK